MFFLRMYESHEFTWRNAGAYIGSPTREKTWNIFVIWRRRAIDRETKGGKEWRTQTQNNSNHRWLFMCCSQSAPRTHHRLIFVIKKIKIQYSGAHNKERWPVAYGISPLSLSSLSPLSFPKPNDFYPFSGCRACLANLQLQRSQKMRMPLKNAVDFYTHILIIINKYWNVGNAWGAYVYDGVVDRPRKKRFCDRKIHFGLFFIVLIKSRHSTRSKKSAKLTGKIPSKNE